MDFKDTFFLLFRLAQQSMKALPTAVVNKVVTSSALWSKDEDQLIADIPIVRMFY